ncbi:SEC14-like protein 2 [Varroa jacobsoni]|uniref:SEC14-like protein 2 n=1 Tax=Varroa jacobsoni TaxID=62625 RepID=UPI000BF6492F|nr:SEC14-like protein 2 [Varroa jacobsoni]
MSGRVGDLSDKQQAALNQFKRVCSSLLTQDWHDDHYCLRWLRARNFNVEASKNMLEKSVDFRRRYRLDHILEEFKPNPGIKAIFPGGTCGFSKDGGCIMIYPLTNILPKYFLQIARRSQVIKMLMHRMEESLLVLREQGKKLGRIIEGHTLIFDVEGFDIMANISAVSISVFTELVGAYECNYPEYLVHAIIINAPPIFHLFFNMIKPLLNAPTLEKVKIYGKDRAQWMAALLEIANPEELPVKFGGTRTGPGNDPNCEHEVVYVHKLNQEIIHELQNLISEEDRMRQITVGRRSHTDVSIVITGPGAGLFVEFESDGHDIALSLLCRTSEDDIGEILPMKRYDSHTGPVVFTVCCDVAGEYLLRFDNSYSSFRSKRISYNFKIIPAANLNEKMLFVHEP